MAIVGGDDRLLAAHGTAVREALEEAEKYSATRVRLAGLNENRPTGNWIVASYTHDTSRELDPQLHTHAVAANLTYDGTEGRWKTLQASGLYERRSYLTEVYRNALAREVRISVPVGWHTLRHSFGTLMKANGEDIKTIQELLRHATFKVTADTYTQAVTPVKRDAQARIAKLIMADGSASKAITPTLQ